MRGGRGGGTGLGVGKRTREGEWGDVRAYIDCFVCVMVRNALAMC